MKGNSLFNRFPDSTSEAVNILEALLEFNPHFRPAAKEILRHKFFDDIRVARLEEGAPFEINLACDQMDAFNYTYEHDQFCENLTGY